MALQLSVRYGHGDLHWFEKQTRDDRIALLAMERLAAKGQE